MLDLNAELKFTKRAKIATSTEKSSINMENVLIGALVIVAVSITVAPLVKTLIQLIWEKRKH